MNVMGILFPALNAISGASTLQLSTTTLSGSPASITNSGGTVISYGNNIIRNAGSPTQTVIPQ